ncbi:MAG: putative DNA binding domain-containing protein [Candidatus Aminicenantes bacterium]|nr:putative DNA binding domain-containing protein [Candidatus Aminicenantes bacterium]
MTELNKLIKKGESKTIEFKETLSEGNNIAKTIIAFSNMAGGKIVIGVEDKSGKIIGIDDDQALDFPDKLSNIVHDKCHPFILPEIYLEYIDEKKILVVEIFPGAFKPYYLKQKGKKEGTYIRVGATNKPADMEMIMELERQKRNISFDEELDYELNEDSLDMERLKTDFRELTGKEMSSNDLLNLKILKKEHDKIHPTIGGLLLAGKTGYLEYARVKCARFKGNNMDEFIDQKEFSGPLYHQVEEAMKFAQVYIAKSGKVVGLRRIDRYEVPLDVIREALVNAVVHRDYSITGSDIKFAIFDDRIEITSPGALPRSLEIEDIIAGRSEIRNKVIARFFKEIEFIEQWGNGIRKILRLLKESGLKEPLFRESGLFFKIIIYKKTTTIIDKDNAKETTKETTEKTTIETNGVTIKETPKDITVNDLETFKIAEKTTKETNGNTTKEINGTTMKTTMKTTMETTTKTTMKTTMEIHHKLLEVIKKNPTISLPELATRMHLTKDGTWYHLKILKKEGTLKRVGPAKGGNWIINKEP